MLLEHFLSFSPTNGALRPLRPCRTTVKRWHEDSLHNCQPATTQHIKAWASPHRFQLDPPRTYLTTMSGPGNGTYLIQLAASPRPNIGVDVTSDSKKPVLVGGRNNHVSTVVFV